jgi:lysine-specific histone demethylase 1
MWKEATPEERKPYEDQANEMKGGYAEAVQAWNQATKKWDRESAALRAAYEKENPFDAYKTQMEDFPREASYKQRRTRNISYAEDDNSDVGL